MTSFEVFALTLLVQLICTNGDSISTGSASSPSASSISSSSVNCTSQERNETVGLFLNLTTIDECAGDASISNNRIMVYPACGSACATKIQEVGDELLDCYYYVAGYDSGNMKEEVANSLAQCELWIPPPPVWVSIYADHNLSSPEASGSDAGADETYGRFVYNNSAASTSVVTLVWVSAGVFSVLCCSWPMQPGRQQHV